MDQFIIESDYMVQCMHVIGTESALTRICWFFKPRQGHFYLKRFLSFQLFNHSFNKYSSQTLCHFIHPFLRKTSSGKWVWWVLPSLRQLTDSNGTILRPAVCGFCPFTHFPGLRPSESCELTQEREEQFSIQVKHPSRGTTLFWLIWVRGGERNMRWNSFSSVKFSRWKKIVSFA